MIHLDHVHKRFGEFVALDDLSLDVSPGGTTVLIGPSGCGKSTTIRMMIGLQTPDQGTVTFEGTPLSRWDLRTMRHRMGYVIQSAGLFPHLTARDNVTLVARELGWAPDRIEGRVRELADLVRLPLERLERFPDELSGGQRQRVGIMRALFLDPDVLLLDEPLGALDPMIRAGLQSDIRTIIRTLGKTAVLVTHDLDEAAYLGDDVVLMRDGRIAQRGKIDELVRSPADDFVSAFIRAQRSALQVP